MTEFKLNLDFSHLSHYTKELESLMVSLAFAGSQVFPA